VTLTLKRRLFLGAWALALCVAALIPLLALLRGTVWIGPGSYVAKTRLNHPLFAIASDVTLKHGSNGLVISLFGPINVFGPVKDDVADFGSALYLHPGAHVDKDVVSVGNSVYRARDVTVGGRIGGEMVAWNGTGTPGATNWFQATSRYSSLSFAAGLALLIICVGIGIAFPWQTVLVANTLNRDAVKSVMAGLMGLFLVAFLVIPLGLSLFGLPFALLLAVAGAAAWLLGLTAAAVVLGKWIAKIRRHEATLLWAVVAGMACLAVAGAVPWIGVLFVGLAGVAGAGSLALTMVARARPVPVSDSSLVENDETFHASESYVELAGNTSAYGRNGS
jgi:hypothetical protein